MLFKRRIPLTRSQRLREMIWPSMGFARCGKYFLRRLSRIKDSTHKIALGRALGVAISFTPTPGLHILQAALFAWILRANVLASFIGTLVGNPLTFPLMWWAAFKLGEFIFSVFGLPVSHMPHSLDFTLADITHDFINLFLPWLIGGYLLAFLSMGPAYVVLYWTVKQARLQQIRWKQDRVHRIARHMTEPQA